MYSHNVSPISGVGDISPFFLVFGRNALSPETIALDVPPHPLPQDLYAKHLVSRIKEAFMRLNAIKSDLRRQQRDLYNSQARTLHIPDGKVVYMRKHHYSSAQTGLASRFIRTFESPYLVVRYPCSNFSDMLILRDLPTGKELSHPVNVEQVVIVPDSDIIDL